jgi:transposase
MYAYCPVCGDEPNQSGDTLWCSRCGWTKRLEDTTD